MNHLDRNMLTKERENIHEIQGLESAELVELLDHLSKSQLNFPFCFPRYMIALSQTF